ARAVDDRRRPVPALVESPRAIGRDLRVVLAEAVVEIRTDPEHEVLPRAPGEVDRLLRPVVAVPAQVVVPEAGEEAEGSRGRSRVDAGQEIGRLGIGGGGG